MTQDSLLHIVIFPPMKSINAGRESAIAHKIAKRLKLQLVTQFNISDIAIRVADHSDAVPGERTRLDANYVAAAIVKNTFCAGARDVSNFYDGGSEDKCVDKDEHLDVGLWIMGLWQNLENGDLDDWLCKLLYDALRNMRKTS